MVDRSFVAKNNAARERLRVLVTRLSDEELGRPMEAGWTIAATLGHMAFWDARGLYLMDKWEGGIAPSAADLEPEAIDWINDATKPLCLALSPRSAAQLALQTAEQTDRRVEALSDEMLAQVRAAGQPFNLSRADHRDEHLDEIEALLSRA
jgi:uncharacterized damage-inducible protein DinB